MTEKNFQIKLIKFAFKAFFIVSFLRLFEAFDFTISVSLESLKYLYI